MNKLITMRRAKLVLAGVSASFLVIHAAMLAIFWGNGVAPMACFNVLSIVFYLFSFNLVYREKVFAYTFGVYAEVVCHMTLAVYFTGWGSGFQIALIGMIILLFFAEYVGRCLQIRFVHALPWSILGMCMYLGVFVVGEISPARYALPGEVSGALQIAWGIIVFGIGISCLQAFVLLTFKSEAMLSTEASRDALTGLPNRHYMQERLEGALKAEDGKARWLAIADVDDFKIINDNHGHNCGDEVLKVLAGILSSVAKGVDVCRWGGEEFLLLGVADAGAPSAVELLERLRVAVEEHGFWYDEKRLRVTMTIGLAFREEGMSTIEWVNAADRRMYMGKNNGKNQVVY